MEGAEQGYARVLFINLRDSKESQDGILESLAALYDKKDLSPMKDNKVAEDLSVQISAAKALAKERGVLD